MFASTLGRGGSRSCDKAGVKSSVGVQWRRPSFIRAAEITDTCAFVLRQMGVFMDFLSLFLSFSLHLLHMSNNYAANLAKKMEF